MAQQLHATTAFNQHAMNSVTGTAADALLAQRVERGDFPLGHHDGGGLGVSGGGGGGGVFQKAAQSHSVYVA